MERNHFDNYEIADISESALNQISDLEKTICSELDKNIVLIAYQSKADKKKENV